MTRRAFTLVELLTVIAIIGILVAILLPAVQAAREAARLTQCRNHLKQLGLGFLTHEQAMGAFPSCGWGWKWVGIPERGTGPNQPGGWAYQILPYTEQQALFDLGSTANAGDWGEAHLVRLTTALEIHHCPTRRATSLYPFVNVELAEDFTRNMRLPAQMSVAKTDYAASVGDAPDWSSPQPASLEAMDSRRFRTPDTAKYTGVTHAFSRVRVSQVIDGTSQTYMLGEKHLNPMSYETGRDEGDDQSVYHGMCSDLVRTAHLNVGSPRHDSGGTANKRVFGSAHVAGCNFAMCDGSVTSISYDIDSEIHRRLGNRQDGLLTSTSK